GLGGPLRGAAPGAGARHPRARRPRSPAGRRPAPFGPGVRNRAGRRRGGPRMTSIPSGAIGTPAGGRRRRIRRTELMVYLFLLPTIVLYGLFTVYPIIGSYWYSFLDWNGFEAVRTWVGLDNYAEVLADPMFWNAFRVTLSFTLVAVPIKVFLALLLAILLNSPRMPWSGFFRTAFFLPVVTTTAIVGVVMQFVFDPASGPVNLVLIELGLVDQGMNFLGDSKPALWTVVGVFVWKWF